MKKVRLTWVILGGLGGVLVLVGGGLVLVLTLGNKPQYLYAGKPIRYWEEQLNGHDAAASNTALVIVNSKVIPELTNAMFHDTRDSKLRIAVINVLEQLPGVQIVFTDSAGRRGYAAQNIGQLGPGARSAVLALVEAVKGNDSAVRGPAVRALGQIRSDPDVVIPLLMRYLDDNDVDDVAAQALGFYGSLAQAAVPKLMDLVHHGRDSDVISQSREAVRKIDPEAYRKLIEAAQDPRTNGPPAKSGA